MWKAYIQPWQQQWWRGVANDNENVKKESVMAWQAAAAGGGHVGQPAY